MSKKFLFSLIIVLVITNIATFIILGDSQSQTSATPDEDEDIDVKQPVATINDEEITYDSWMKSLRQEYGQKRLKYMINHELVQQMAKEKNIEVDEKIIERELSQLVSAGGVMSKEETEEWKEERREDIVYRFQLESLLTRDTSIPEEDLKSFYDDYENQYDFDERIQLSHIVLPDEQTAEKVKSELDDGASFPLLAREYSTDEETRNDDGYLGYFKTSSQFIPTGYKDVIEQMDPYSYSGPVQTNDGVGIVRVHQILPEITFTYDEVKPYVKNELALEKMDQNLDAEPLWDEADIDWLYED